MQTRDGVIPHVAYFCMEFGLDEEFQIYAGGLGILAGDALKSAGAAGLPLVGVGILWRQGYTTQVIGEDGWPHDAHPEQRWDFLEDSGARVAVRVWGKDLALKVWRVEKYGNAPLYLLDADLPENVDRWITGQLYGGGPEARICQEIVLGIGGVRALRALSIPVDVYHFNEGHAVLAGVELIREKMEQGMDFEAAWAATRREIVFTTHTPVMAGNESHGHDLLARMGAYNGLRYEQMARLGGEPFGMTVAGLRTSRVANAVAELHGETARRMWAGVTDKAPITHVTNGVHPGTWQDPGIRAALQSRGDLWAAHQAAKRCLIEALAADTGARLRADALLIGFARRATPYKRSDLIFRRPEVIEPLLNEGRVQIVFSGKPHPHDEQGKHIVQHLVRMSQRFPDRVVFWPDYDMRIGRLLTQGCDVWLNNPRRPLEASGTSGMKAALNGVLNGSVLDGWWPEGCEHGVNGWQFGDAYEGPDQDDHDAEALYRVLLHEILPVYEERRDRWIAMMRASIAMADRFTSDRMVAEYFEKLYAGSGRPLAAVAG